MNKISKIAALATASCGLVAGVAGAASANAGAIGSSSHSPGVVSGNTIELPVNVPVNACGLSVDVIGALNPAALDRCANNS